MVKNKRHDIVKLSKFKTSICTYYNTPSGCPFGERCAFAHGEEELREETENNSLTNDCLAPREETDAEAGSTTVNKKTKGPTASKAPPARPRTPDSSGKVHSKSVNENTPLTALLAQSSSLAPVSTQPDNSNDIKDLDGRCSGTKTSATAGGAPPHRHREGGRKRPHLTHLDPSTTVPGTSLHTQGLLPISPSMLSCMLPYYGASSSSVPMYIPYSSIQHPYCNINNHSYVNVVMDAPLPIEPSNYTVPMVPAHLFLQQPVHDYPHDKGHLTSSAPNANARPWHPTADLTHSTSSVLQADSYPDAFPHSVVPRPKGAHESCGVAPAPIFSEIGMTTSTKVGPYPPKIVPEEATYSITHGKGSGSGAAASVPTLQSLMSSTTPPTIVHIPFSSAMAFEQCRTGDMPTSGSPSPDACTIDLALPAAEAVMNGTNTDNPAWPQGFSTQPPLSSGCEWGGFTVLPESGAFDVTALRTLSTPQASCEETPPWTNFEDFLRTVSQDEDECMDLNRFLSQWAQFVTTSEKNGQESNLNPSRLQNDEASLQTDFPTRPTASGLDCAPNAVVPATALTDIADRLKEPLQVNTLQSVVSALQPHAPLKERDDGLSSTGPDAAPTSGRAKKSTALSPRRAGLVCSMFCEKTIPTKENTGAGKDTVARAVRRPVMKNCFASSCTTKGNASERPNSILLYNVEKNTVYYITAPCC